jgi:hypothetical protein
MTNQVDRIATVRVYEWDGEEKPKGQTIDKLTVKSHWNRGDLIVIRISGCPEVTVVARDLITAIKSATL